MSHTLGGIGLRHCRADGHRQPGSTTTALQVIRPAIDFQRAAHIKVDRDVFREFSYLVFLIGAESPECPSATAALWATDRSYILAAFQP